MKATRTKLSFFLLSCISAQCFAAKKIHTYRYPGIEEVIYEYEPVDPEEYLAELKTQIDESFKRLHKLLDVTPQREQIEAAKQMAREIASTHPEGLLEALRTQFEKPSTPLNACAKEQQSENLLKEASLSFAKIQQTLEELQKYRNPYRNSRTHLDSNAIEINSVNDEMLFCRLGPLPFRILVSQTDLNLMDQSEFKPALLAAMGLLTSGIQWPYYITHIPRLFPIKWERFLNKEAFIQEAMPLKYLILVYTVLQGALVQGTTSIFLSSFDELFFGYITGGNEEQAEALTPFKEKLLDALLTIRDRNRLRCRCTLL